MATSYYDIAVLGTDLPGLVYGALAAKAGYRILILGQDSLQSTYIQDGQTYYRHMPLVYGLRSSEIIRNVFRDLGLYQEMRNRPEVLNPGFQIISGSTWFSYYQEARLREAEFSREFGERAKDIQGFLGDNARLGEQASQVMSFLPPLPVSGFIGKYLLNRQIDRSLEWLRLHAPLQYPDHPQFFSGVGGMLYLMGNARPKPVNPLASRRLLTHALAGFIRFPGSIDGFKQLFTGRFTHRGGEFRPQTSAGELVLRRNTFTELKLARTQETVTFRLLVCNTSARRFLQLIPPELASRRTEELSVQLQPQWVRYVVNISLESRQISEALAENLIHVGSVNRELRNENLLWVHKLPGDAAPGQKTSLAVFCHVPAAELPTSEEGFGALNLRILDSLQKSMPFLEPSRVTMSTPYLHRDRESGKLVMNPREVQEVYETALESMAGLSPLPLLTGLKNLLMLGEGSFGSLGIEGSFLAARMALDWTVRNLRQKRAKAR